jgi:transposase
MPDNRGPHSSQRRYPPEMRERAVRLVAETIAEAGERHGAVTKVARQLGIGAESVRTWVAQAEMDAGQRPGLTSEERERLKTLERENRELRRANEILRSASAFFAAEFDRRSSR